jgi:cytochrome c oxidase accessory protein FixG
MDPAAAGLGSCVDCKLCVHVCPTGIDIRNGTQYECIGCAACIDACDAVMAEVGYPKGLVRYASESGLAGKPKPLLRARTVGYGAMIVVVGSALAYGLLMRVPLAVDIIRDRARLYREVSGGAIENVYTLKLMNKSQHSHEYRVRTEDGFQLTAPAQVTVDPGEVKNLPVQVRLDRSQITSTSMTVPFVIEMTTDPEVRVRQEGSFLAPAAAVHHGEKNEHDDEHEEGAH